MPLNNPPVIIKNNGTTQGAVNTLNFTGSISANVTGNVATINVSGGGGGSFSAVEIEIDFGDIPTRSKTFIVIDINIYPTSTLIVGQSGNAATGRSADENEMDPIIFSGQVSSGQFTLIANTINGPVVGKYRAVYTIG